jgi:hypothetical protein
VSTDELNRGVRIEAGTLIITILMAAITIVLNKVLYDTMKPLSFKEKHQSKIHRMQSLLSKAVIAQTLNTIFIPAIMYAISPG